MPKKPDLKQALAAPKDEKTAKASKTSETVKTFQTTKTAEGKTLYVDRVKKGRLRRATIYLRPEQWRLLRIRAAERETDVSGLVRDLVDSALG
jgi:hypothetical protein